VGPLEGRKRQLDYDLLDSDNNPERRDVNRMPVIVDPDSYDLWLDPGMRDVSAASELLKPVDARLMRCYPVSTRINRVANDEEECSAPVKFAQIQNRLFS
jgi:putative SOS response-associated peptidase YedK